MTRRPSFQPVEMALFSMAVVWGVGYSIVKTALGEMGPMAFNATRYVAALVTALFVCRLVERDFRLPRRDWGTVLALGVLGHFGSVALHIAGLARTTTTNASLIIAATPVLVALINVARRSERLSARNWIGVGLSFVGIFLVITGGAGTRSQGSLSGDLMQVASAVLYAVYFILLTRLSPQATPLRVTVWSMLAATVLMIGAAIPELRNTAWGTLSPITWLGIGYSGILSIGLSSVIWQWGVQKVGSSRASVYNFLSPVITVAIGWAVLHEVLTTWQWFGVAAVLVGVWLGRRE